MRHVDTAADVPGPAIPMLDDGPGSSRDGLVATHRPHVGTGNTSNTGYVTIQVTIPGGERWLWDHAPAPPVPMLDQGLPQPTGVSIERLANGPRIVHRDGNNAEQTVVKSRRIGTRHDPPADPVPICRQRPLAPLGSGGANSPDVGAR